MSPLSQPKFSPSQQIACLFIVKFPAPRTVDPVRGSDRGTPTEELGYSHRRDFPRRTRRLRTTVKWSCYQFRTDDLVLGDRKQLVKPRLLQTMID